MIGKKINQLATELAPTTTDLTIIGDPVTGVSKKITLEQLGAIFGGAVSFYTTLGDFPATGVIDIIYCAKDTKKLYLWSGSAYVEVFPSQSLLDTYQLRSEKGVSNGYASLDVNGKVPIGQLPNSIMEYKGTWNAATNTPTLANGTGDTGDVYICNAAGTVNFGAGPITFAVGDYVVYSGTIWQRSSGAVGTVTSVGLSITGDSIGVTGSPITTSGTLALAFAGTSGQYINGAGSLTTFPSLTGFVPYTGATGQVNLGAYDLLVQTLTIGKGNSGLANNTALGYRTLFHITTGNYNTAVGYEAAHNTTTGQYNTALGQSALFTNTTGSQNTAIGLNALLNNTTGGSNVVVGLDALQHNTTGSSNTALGYNAGSHITGGSTPNTTASNSVYIGRDTKAKVDGGANEIVIGYNAIGNGSNTATFGNTSTTANYFTGSINGGSFVKSGGTSAQFLKADGSVDSSSYITLASLSAGAGISYNNTTGVIASTITQYTDALARAAISLTTTGTSGAATYNNTTGVLNIPQYQTALTNPVTGTGTTNYLPKFTGASTIGDSTIQTDATGNLMVGSANAGNAGSINVSVGLAGTTSGGLQLWAATNQTHYIQFGDATTGASPYTGYLGYAHNNDSLIFGTSTSTKMTLSASGNLGLGVTPSDWFVVYKALQIGSYGAAISGQTNDQALTLWNNAYPNASNVDTYTTTNTANKFRMDSGSFKWFSAPLGTAGNAISFTQAMTLNASGNLSIGNTNDTYKLEVTGEGRFYQSATSSTAYLRVENNRSRNAALRLTTTLGDYYLGVGIGADVNQFQIYDGNAGATRLTIASTGAATFSSTITQLGEQLLVSNAGTPNIQLRKSGVTDWGSMTYTGSLLQLGTFAGGQTVNITTGGNVGIGTTNPTEILHLRDSANGYCGLRLEGTGTYAGSDWTMYASSTSPSSANDFLGFYNNSTTDGASAGYKMSISKNGNVGIGTSSPSALLHLSQSTTNLNLYLQNTSGSGKTWAVNSDNLGSFNIHDTTANRLTITSGGNVGIGNTNPNSPLDVSGTIRTRTSSGSASLLLQDGSASSKWEIGHQSNNLYFYNYTAGSSSMTITSGGNVELLSSIKTASPSSGSAHPWKLGSYAAGGTGTATGVIYIEVNGQIYSIPALLGTP